MAIPEVRLYLNSLIGAQVGDGEVLWPIELFERYLQGRTFDRALSIGCGSGALERELVRRGMCRTVDAFDGSVVSLRQARIEADAMGFRSRIRYFAADFNRPAFPRSRYDIVLFHQSAHHVAKLEKLYLAIMKTLKTDGMVYMDEYIGPSRFEWAKRRKLLDPHRRIWEKLPHSLRAVDVLMPPVQPDDPSEAIRSSEIEPLLAVGFQILGHERYGGGILSVILPNLRLGNLDRETLLQLIEEDRNAPAFYTILAAKPKSGWPATVAKARYWFVPKAKRVLRILSRIQ